MIDLRIYIVNDFCDLCLGHEFLYYNATSSSDYKVGLLFALLDHLAVLYT